MLNYLWGFMIIIGVVYAAINGTLPDVTEAAISSSKEAVALCITMMGVMSFWVGMMRIAENSGIIGSASKKLEPFLHFIFPNLPKGHKANEYIATNIIANIFGLGWAATPAGLKAMEALAELEEERKSVHRNRGAGVASDEMCTFLIINISSLQLIPVNIVAYRSQYGSVNPSAVIGPGLVATLISTGVALLFCKIMYRKEKRI